MFVWVHACFYLYLNVYICVFTFVQFCVWYVFMGYMFMCVCIHDKHICTIMHVYCVHIYIYLSIYLIIHKHLIICVYLCVHVCLCVYVFACVCLCAYMTPKRKEPASPSPIYLQLLKDKLFIKTLAHI